MTAHNGRPAARSASSTASQGDNAQEAISNLTPEVDIGKVDQGDGNDRPAARTEPLAAGRAPLPGDSHGRHDRFDDGSVQLRAIDGS